MDTYLEDNTYFHFTYMYTFERAGSREGGKRGEGEVKDGGRRESIASCKP